MSLHLEMLQVARLAPGALGESSDLVGRFLRREQNEDGGFKDRAGQSDLYYTVFGLDGVLSVPSGENDPLGEHSVWRRASDYVESFGKGEALDLVHLCCWARAKAAVNLWSNTPQTKEEAVPLETWATQVERYRSEDGGYHPVPGNKTGTAYGCFLALGGYQDMGLPMPCSEGILRCLQDLRTGDGGWANDIQLQEGSTNATAAALSVLRQVHMPAPEEALMWLKGQAHAQGGFRASPTAPMPDLLSTATALHALSGESMDLDALREGCLDFIDTLWTNEGAFHGHWADDSVDVEYTFYGLLALGHLSV